MDSERKKRPYRDLPEEDPGESVAVARFDAPHEAHLAMLHLEAQGIAARVTNDLVVGMAPHLGSGMAGVQVVVAERDAAEAYEQLEQLRIEVRKEQARRRQELSEVPGSSGAGARFAVGLGALLLVLIGWLALR